MLKKWEDRFFLSSIIVYKAEEKVRESKIFLFEHLTGNKCLLIVSVDVYCLEKNRQHYGEFVFISISILMIGNTV